MIIEPRPGVVSSDITRGVALPARPRSTLQSAIGMRHQMLVFLAPILLIAVAYLTRSVSLPIVAFASQLLGLGAERWYFFAEARHPQNLYYQ